MKRWFPSGENLVPKPSSQGQTSARGRTGEIADDLSTFGSSASVRSLPRNARRRIVRRIDQRGRITFSQLNGEFPIEFRIRTAVNERLRLAVSISRNGPIESGHQRCRNDPPLSSSSSFSPPPPPPIPPLS